MRCPDGEGSRQLSGRGAAVRLEAAGLIEAGASDREVAKRNINRLTALIKTRLKQRQYRPALLDGLPRQHEA